jgi:hypothetical protein
MTPKPNIIHPRKSPRRAILAIGTALSLTAYVGGLFCGIPNLSDGNPRDVSDSIYPALWMLPLFALTSGFGLSLPLACLWANRLNRRALLRFTWGRGLASIIMFTFLPAGFLGVLPVWFTVVLSINLFHPKPSAFNLQFFLSSPSTALNFIFALSALGLITLFSFALIYGLRMRWRLPAFVALWCGISASLVLGGYGFGFSL